MQFKVASVLALAATASAFAGNASFVSYTTEIVTAVTTVCPAATQISFNGQTYTVTESTTLTITNCPCTVSKPVYTTSSVVCNTCAAPTTAPTTAPVYANTTAPVVPASTPVGTVGVTTAPASSPTPSGIPVNGANKAMAVSGAGLAGLLGLAAYLL